MIKLQVKNQVTITESFKLQARLFLVEKLAQLNRIDHQPSGSNLSLVVQQLNYQQTETGFAAMITRMKQLPYAEFTAVVSAGEVMFKARTHPLKVQVPESKRYRPGLAFPPGQYDIGSYSIYVPISALIHGNLQPIHFIPEGSLAWRDQSGREAYFDNRHLHHYAFYAPHHTGQKIGNPLTYETRTCWGNFGAILSMNMEAGDLPEIFRSLYLFVTIQNVDSPLVDWRNLTHYKKES